MQVSKLKKEDSLNPRQVLRQSSSKEDERPSFNRNIFNKVRTLEPPLNADEEEWEDENCIDQSDWDELKNESEDEESEEAKNEMYDWQLQNDYHIQKAAERQKQKRQEEESKRRLMKGIYLEKNQKKDGGLWTSLTSMFSFGCASTNDH